MPDKHVYQTLKTEFEHELFDNVLPFWERYSPDKEHGGYFNHLDRDGAVYDTTKNVWLQARQVWMFSKLYNAVEQRPEWLEIATTGIEFLQKYAVREDGLLYFALAADGQPIYRQRKIYSECFYAMALAEYARATQKPDFAQESRSVFKMIMAMIEQPEKTGRPILPGAPDLQTLGIPMIMLNLIEEIAADDYSDFQEQIDFCIERVKQHFIDGKVYENVTPDGQIAAETAAGRLLLPGHAIEAGWFLLHWAEKLNNPELRTLCFAIIRNMFEIGWDEEHGGIFYFLDAEGYSPVQLEWDMKLWWPICEAMYAFLLLYSLEKDESDWQKFVQIKEYAFSHFSDPEYGEWYGYLNRRGEVTHRFKGGAYKGCFHVPRALWLCWQLLEKLETETQ